MSHSPRRSARVVAGAATVAGLMLLGACGVNPQPTDYGEKYQENFMVGCTGVDTEGDVPSGGEKIAPVSTCECIYDGLVEKVPFDEAKAFEEAQADAESGDDIEIPENIQSVYDDCSDSR